MIMQAKIYNNTFVSKQNQSTRLVKKKILFPDD